jgi:hypothetical protein
LGFLFAFHTLRRHFTGRSAVAVNLSEEPMDWRRANGMTAGAQVRRCLKTGSDAAYRATQRIRRRFSA